ncbi:MAG: Flp family type IVb pilin [Chloroflexota bacterium]|nr:MAG: Flp family type IVb pilin [Chloroflexota bacterium]
MFWKLYKKMQEQSKKEEGQGLAEVALFLVLVVIVAVVVLGNLGTQITTTFQSVVTALGG